MEAASQVENVRERTIDLVFDSHRAAADDEHSSSSQSLALPPMIHSYEDCL